MPVQFFSGFFFGLTHSVPKCTAGMAPSYHHRHHQQALSLPSPYGLHILALPDPLTGVIRFLLYNLLNLNRASRGNAAISRVSDGVNAVVRALTQEILGFHRRSYLQAARSADG